MTEESQPVPRQRVRVRYAKGESIKFISHHDEFRLWERTLRRADAPLLYKQGFNPQPHIQFAAPLGVGITGADEPVDLILSPPQAVDVLAARLRAKLPPGVQLQSVIEIPLDADALQNVIIGADYTIVIYAEPDEIPAALLQARIEHFLKETAVWRERERKGRLYTYNLRPLIFELRYEGYDVECEEHRIFLRVQMRAGATGRPDEVVDALGLDDFARMLRRERIYFENEPDDSAIFAAYPVITQEDVAAPPGVRGASVRRAADGADEFGSRDGQRSINERAGDEFV